MTTLGEHGWRVGQAAQEAELQARQEAAKAEAQRQEARRREEEAAAAAKQEEERRRALAEQQVRMTQPFASWQTLMSSFSFRLSILNNCRLIGLRYLPVHVAA